MTDLDPLERARRDPRLQVGRYLLLEELGRGGMGVVHRAHDPVARRDVALKQLLHADADAVLRFEREGEALARLAHPGIVRVFELGRHEGRPFVVQELVAGGPPACGPALAVDAALELIAQACDALAHAHARGVLHRDLKPSNLLVDAGRVRVLDFGLALLDDRSRLSQSGAALGTPEFMPPEQVEGRSDQRSDVYGLGATLFALLTGRPPFEGPSTVNVLHAVLSQPPRAPSSLRADVPPAVDALVLRCLAKTPGARFQDVAALAVAVDEARRAPPARSGRHALLATLGLVVGVAVTLAATSPWREPDPAPAPLVEPATAAQVGGTDASVESDDAPQADEEPDERPAPADAAPVGSAERLVASGDGAELHGRQLAREPFTTRTTSGKTLCWDRRRRRLLLVTLAPLERRSERPRVWSLPIDGGEWVPLEIEGPGPSHRADAAAALDALRDNLVLVGGAELRQGTDMPLNDVWELPLGDRPLRWKRCTPAPVAEFPTRHRHAMAWDGERVLLYGGRSAGGALPGGVLAWDGERWEDLAVPFDLEVGRIFPTLVVDAGRAPVVVGGASKVDAALGVAPAHLAPPGGPFTRTRHAPAAAWTSRGLLVIGGREVVSPSTEVRLEDLWLLADGRWRELRPTADWPKVRGALGLVMVDEGRLAMSGGGARDGTWLLRIADE